MKPAQPLPGTPEFTAATRANLLTALGPGFLGIQCAIIFSNDADHNDDPSRVAAFDPNGLLMRAVRSNLGPDRGQWSTDAGQNHNEHLYKVRCSYRSRTTPSVQICAVDAHGGQYPEMLIMDVDEHNPFEEPLEHALEVLKHKLSPRKKDRTTDPKVIARMLAKAISVEHSV